MENYITHLHGKNIGVFDELDISFNPKFNLIVGPNGCGKTSILKAIALALNPYAAQNLRYKENSAVWFDAKFGSQCYRIGLGEGWVSNIGEYRKASLRTWAKPPSANEVTALTVSDVESKHINIAPLILGAYRRIEYKRIDGMRREKGIDDQRRNYHESGFARVDGGTLPDVKQWMINRYFEIEKSWAHIYKRNWDWLIGNLNRLAPSNVDLSFKEIKRDLEPMFTFNGTLDCYLEEVSAGFQSLLSLVFAIVEWIEGTNDEDNAYIPKATGTVIVDELDVHLHPEWQLTIRDSLRAVFPNLQFIVTTHSPHLIASAQPGEIIVLPTLNGRLNVRPTAQTYGGWSTDEILEDVMGVKNLENKAYSQILNEALDCVESGKIELLEQSIEKLRAVVHPSNTILQVLQVKLAGLKLEDGHDKD